MKLYGALVLLLTVSAACGLKCYLCGTNNKDCKQEINCPPPADHCSSATVDGVTIRGCALSQQCRDPIKCCNTDLCNGAIPTGSSVLLLLVTSAITATFL